MNYYKLIDQQNISGVITSNDFIAYYPSADCYLSATDLTGEYANYDNKLYRDTWMKPYQVFIPHQVVKILPITFDEYQILKEMFKTEETIRRIEIEEQEEIIEDNTDPSDISTLDFIRTTKINEMSYTCRTTIEAGFDLELRGVMKHFSLDTQDQLNLISLSAMAQTQTLIPYHADGEECVFYTNEEINEIVETATAFKIYHTTYYNALKTYINALETIEEISAITYGVEIPDEYKSDVLKVLEQ